MQKQPSISTAVISHHLQQSAYLAMLQFVEVLLVSYQHKL
jgi:hypothetical protein